MGNNELVEKQYLRQWPVSVTLILCALFAATILIKAKSDFNDVHTKKYSASTSAAEQVAANLDSVLFAAKSDIIQYSYNKNSNLSGALSIPKNIAAISRFDQSGLPFDTVNLSANDLMALSAASQLAKESAWFGTIARGRGNYAPAISIMLNDGTIVSAILKIPTLSGLKQNQSLIITDISGNIIFSTQGMKLEGINNINDAYGINTKQFTKAPGAQDVKSLKGDKLILGSAPTKTNFMIFVEETNSLSSNLLLRTGLFYALLFMGPILAFLGIWYIVKSQSFIFEQNRQLMLEAERRLKIAIEGARCGVWDWDITEDTVYFTNRLAKSFGFPEAGKYETTEVMAALSPEDRLRLRAALNAAPQIGTIDITLCLRAINEKGIAKIKNAKHVQFRGRYLGDRNDSNKIRVIGVSIDVSDQIDNENRVASAEKRLRDAIDSFSGAFALWGKDGNLLLWNDGFKSSFGIDGSKLFTGAKYEDISKIAATSIVSQRADSFDSKAQELELLDNKWLRLIERKTTEGGVVSIGVDITPQKATEAAALLSEKELRKAVLDLQKSQNEMSMLAKQYEKEKVRAEQASSSKNTFLANMSHELRTPLNAINGFSQMMAEEIYGPLGDKRYVEYSQDILTSGRHLLELINDVLDMAKIEAGKFLINPQNMSISEIVEQVTRMMHGRIEEKDLTLELDLSEIDEIRADSRAIRQIFLNLISNAIKFTDNHGRILVRTVADDDKIVISVIDTGIGISEENLPRLGHAFEQVENEHSRINQGTGLGLALCRSFTEMHGGEFTISSKVGVGTKVDVILPRRAIISEEAA